MNTDCTALFDESIKLELRIADIYLEFYGSFLEDSAFWWSLALEEKAHAALIRSGKDFIGLDISFPCDIFPSVLKELVDANSRLDLLAKKYKETSCSREEAFNVAFEIEISAGEMHFQDFIDKKANSKLHSILKDLNSGDQDHAKRIRSYMEDHGIELWSGKA